MTNNRWRRVTQAEFEAYLQANPTLVRDVVRFCEPPVAMYHDPAVKQWPESVRAKVQLYTKMKGLPDYAGEPDQHYLRGDASTAPPEPAPVRSQSIRAREAWRAGNSAE